MATLFGFKCLTLIRKIFKQFTDQNTKYLFLTKVYLYVLSFLLLQGLSCPKVCLMSKFVNLCLIFYLNLIKIFQIWCRFRKIWPTIHNFESHTLNAEKRPHSTNISISVFRKSVRFYSTCMCFIHCIGWAISIYVLTTMKT